MRYVLLALIFTSCGEGPAAPADMAVSLPTVDQAEPVVLDLAQPPGPDMARPPACTAPLPGVYTDVLQFNYAPLSSPNMVASVQAITTTIVRNDGAIVRPSPAIPTPFDYHCDFAEASVDPGTCTAPCCAGQAGTPTFYFDELGWVLATSGVCTFQTTSAVTYEATIVDGAGTRSH